MTERGRDALDDGPHHFAVGPSHLRWEGETLIIHVEEITVPIPGRLKGEIRFHPAVDQPQGFALDTGARHHWWPYAPFGTIEARFEHPTVSWTGHGYADTNTGTAALEADFTGWTWSRASTPDGATLFYEPTERTGASHTVAVAIDKAGHLEPCTIPPKVHLKPGLWGIDRWTRSQGPAAVLQTMVDAPFYTRDAITMELDGTPCPAVHESLNLDRFAAPWVKVLLPFRMPRRARWSAA